MSNAARQLDALSSALYVAPRERHDCCARCWHSKPVEYQNGGAVTLRCGAHGGAQVAASGVCALWRAISRKGVAA